MVLNYLIPSPTDCTREAVNDPCLHLNNRADGVKNKVGYIVIDRTVTSSFNQVDSSLWQRFDLFLKLFNFSHYLFKLSLQFLISCSISNLLPYLTHAFPLMLNCLHNLILGFFGFVVLGFLYGSGSLPVLTILFLRANSFVPLG